MFDFPNAPTNGQLVQGGAGQFYAWDGAKWVGKIGGSTVTVSDTPPASPLVGSQWFDGVSATMFVWFNDGTSSQWVPVINQPGIGSPVSVANGGTGVTTAAAAPWVEVSGDTMTGGLAIQPATGWSGLTLSSTGGNRNAIYGNRGAIQRWEMDLGDSTIETGSNAGSNFGLSRFNDAGTYIDSPLSINRASGTVSFADNIIVGAGAGFPATVYLIPTPPSDTAIEMRKSGSGQYNLIWGKTGATNRWVIIPGDNAAESGSNAGSNFQIQRYNDAGTVIDVPLQINRATGATTLLDLTVSNGRIFGGGGYFYMQNQSSGGYVIIGSSGDPTNYFRHSAHSFLSPGGAATWAIFDAANTRNISGAWAQISDAATKERIEPYTTGLAALIELAPVTFTYRAGTPVGDDGGRTRVGLIAQDVEPHVPEIVGREGDLLTLQPSNLIYAVVNALREIDARLARIEMAR